ncbi:hypothetical protein NKH77_45990 [Streptomyces sp. M19]
MTRLGLARQLAALARDGLAVLLLSHDHALVRALADHVVLLDTGRVVGTGGPELLPPAPGSAAVTDPAPRPEGPTNPRTPRTPRTPRATEPKPEPEPGPGLEPGPGPEPRPGSRPEPGPRCWRCVP